MEPYKWQPIMGDISESLEMEAYHGGLLLSLYTTAYSGRSIYENPVSGSPLWSPYMAAYYGRP